MHSTANAAAIDLHSALMTVNFPDDTFFKGVERLWPFLLFGLQIISTQRIGGHGVRLSRCCSLLFGSSFHALPL